MGKAQQWLSQPEKVRSLLEKPDYRAFLELYFTECKAAWPSFSFSYLARKTGFSKTLVRAIFEGEKRITHKTLPAILVSLELPKLLTDYFETLVAIEESFSLTDKSRRQLEKKLKAQATLYLESLEGDANVDVSFSNPHFPIIYASLGDQSDGATEAEIIKRSGLPEDLVVFTLKEMELKKFVKRTPIGWIGTKLFLTVASKNPDSWVKPFYLDTLKALKTSAEHSFQSDDKLYWALAFTVDSSELPELKQELRRVINRFAADAQTGAGDKVVRLSVGLF